ncbi:MAG: D-alanyl-D-alanine carboxypeptidase [Clostridiales bacterium]|nr:D-alanyl-D-alanine carboxypeptidase [Clostridiales bacterium]MCF8021210.1 D-alanyl-D-alanine carboxypeptidase [Clostridiales bacterium]
MKYNRLLILLVLVLCFISVIPAYAENSSPSQSNTADSPALETTAESAVLMDYTSGQILFSKQPDKELPMASVTKLMTLLLAVEEIESGKMPLEDTIITSETAAGMGGSQIYLEPGEEMSVKDMLISIATGSANDASVAMAEKIAGSEDLFVEKMNQKVKDLGLKHTHFVNATGLPAENHYTSAHDMAVILRECVKHPQFRKVSSIYEYDLRGGEFKLWNTNKLLKWYKGVDAGKTGWTSDADYCLATSAKRDDMRLITVVLGTSEPRSHFRESIKIYDFGFARYQKVKLVDSGSPVKNVRVNRGKSKTLRLLTGQQAGLVTEKDKSQGFYGEVNAPEEINAPVKKGEVLGTYHVLKDKKEIMTVPLIAENAVPRASVFGQMYKVLNEMYKVDFLKTG